MGADLYVYGHEDEEGEYYFRDSYGPNNLLWNLGLSYTELFDPLVDENGYIDADGCKKILEVVKKQSYRLKYIDDAYIIAKYYRFIYFLELCIENGGMIASY